MDAREQFVSRMVELCSPLNAETNPRTAAFLGIVREPLVKVLAEAYAHCTKVVAVVAIGLTESLAASVPEKEWDSNARSGMFEFLYSLGDISQVCPSAWEPLDEVLTGVGRGLLGGEICEPFFHFVVAAPLYDAINRALVEGIPLTAVPIDERKVAA